MDRDARHDYERIQANGVSDFLDWVKMRSHLFRGVTFGTMLRDEAYHFIRLGTHMERADNTARILDTKYHILLPSVDDVGGAVDYYQWASLLQSLSGFESYRKIYSDVITPRRIAELLILRDDMPRSLHSCMNFIHDTLEILCDDAQSRARAAGGRAARAAALRRAPTTSCEFGLHEYLMEFLERISGWATKSAAYSSCPPTSRPPDLAHVDAAGRSIRCARTDCDRIHRDTSET